MSSYAHTTKNLLQVFDAQLAGMEAAAAQLAAKVQVVDHLWSTGYIRKSGECQADELLIKVCLSVSHKMRVL